MTAITIHAPPQSTYARTVRMVCEEKGAAYELASVQFGSPEHLALHPFGKVPACVCDGATVYETLAICTYLDEVLPGASLVPANAMERAHMYRWISLINDYGYKTMIKQLVLPRFGMVEVDDSVVRDAVAESVRQLGIADRELGNKPYLAGQSLSIADLFLVPIVDYLMAFPDIRQSTAELTNLRRWYETLAGRASFNDTKPPAP